MEHTPVLTSSAIEYLRIRPDGIYVDATFGAGGHSAAIVAALRSGRLVAIDTDASATARAATMESASFAFVSGNFRDLRAILDVLGIGCVDGVLFDLGVSSMQFDDPSRGFSMTKDAPLDMRMNRYEGRSAYEVLATASERELADIFFTFGEERAARRVARAIVTRRQRGALPKTTTDFARFVAGVVHTSGRRERIHPATRVFQALRIAVNDELGALKDGMSAAIGSLRSGGRIVAISFHSLEDRVVKQMLRSDERIDVLTGKPVRPDASEIAENPRSRSAKLRAGERKAS
ncbi:MAG: 16S rRNA (cytosine(1402)-N(4))-methyltransferase RsmH [Candidatus Tyrphobacter sp.]